MFYKKLKVKKGKRSKSDEDKASSSFKILGLDQAIKKPIVWVLGGPGVGKGAQCNRIAAKYGFTHISTGDLLRGEAKTGSVRGQIIAEILKQDDQVPNEIVLELLNEAIKARDVYYSGFLIDGYPCDRSQAAAFEQYIGPCTVIFYLEASSDTLTKRLLNRCAGTGGSSDDEHEGAIERRIMTFHDNIESLLAPYTAKVVRIDAERSVEEVFAYVVYSLDPIIKSLPPQPSYKPPYISPFK